LIYRILKLDVTNGISLGRKHFSHEIIDVDTFKKALQNEHIILRSRYEFMIVMTFKRQLTNKILIIGCSIIA